MLKSIVSYTRFVQNGTGATVRAILDKLRDSVVPKDFGAVGDGSTDDSAKIQLAIDQATSGLIGESYVNLDLSGKTYGVGSGFIVKAGVVLSNGALLAVGTSWAITDPMVTINNSEHAGLYRVLVDCQWKCAGVLRNSGYRSSIDRCTIQRFKTYGVWDTGTTQEATLTNSIIRQFDFGDTGFDSVANRDAPCLWVDTADSQYSNLTLYYGSIPLYVTGPLNLFSNIHVYNGATTDGGEIAVLKIEGTTASNNQFTNLYADNGVIYLVDNFKQTFKGVHAQLTVNGTNSKFMELTSSTADADGSGLSVDDVRLNGGYLSTLTFTTTGAGTWATDKKIHWDKIRTTTGGTLGANIAQWLNKVVIDSSSRLILGNTVSTQIGNNQSKLQVKGDTLAEASVGLFNYGNTADPALLILGKSRGGAIGTYAQVLLNDYIGQISFVGDDGTSLDYNASGIKVIAKAAINWSGSRRDTDLVFQTTVSNVLTDSLILEAAGNFRPATNGTKSIGTATYGFQSVYTTTGYYVNGIKVLGPQDTGWTAATGTASKGTFDTATVTLEQLAQQVKAIRDLLATNGITNA